ncbi:hypothetical protein Ntsu_32180 [Nocardia sp. IFM 10818]
MRVGAADTEGGHARATCPAGLRPCPALGEDGDVASVPVDFGRGLVDVQRAGEYAVVHGHDHFDHARDSGGGLGVADVGFDRSEPEGVLAVLAVGGDQCLGFDGVAESCSGAVGFDGVDVGGL